MKAALDCCLSPVRTATAGKRSLHSLPTRTQTSAASMKIMIIPQNNQSGNTCDPAVPLLSVHPKDMKSAHHGDTCTFKSTAAVFTVSRK